MWSLCFMAGVLFPFKSLLWKDNSISVSFKHSMFSFGVLVHYCKRKEIEIYIYIWNHEPNMYYGLVLERKRKSYLMYVYVCRYVNFFNFSSSSNTLMNFFETWNYFKGKNLSCIIWQWTKTFLYYKKLSEMIKYTWYKSLNRWYQFNGNLMNLVLQDRYL